MASLNPFDLLGDDAEDPSQIAAALPKKVEKAAPVQSAKAAKMPTKPLPPSEAVRESKNASSGGRGGGGRGYSRGGGGGGRGYSRGGGGGRGFNRDYRNNDAPGNENGYSGGGGGYRPSEDADGARRGTTVGGFRGGGRGGGRRGFPNVGESGDVEHPRRTYERRSGTGRGNDLKREGGGRGNWGTTEDDMPPATEEPTAEVEKSPVAEKQGGEDETADASKEVSAEEQEKKEAEDKEMTLEEYEKILEEKKKALQATKVEERKVDTKVFESMQQLSNKKNTEEEIFVKLGSDKDKRKDAAEKAKKSLNIHEFLKPADGESFRGGYRGRGGGRGGRGQRGGSGNGGGNQRYGGGTAPAIGDTAQFPSLGK